MAGADSKFGKKEQEEKDGRKLLKLFVAHNALKIQKKPTHHFEYGNILQKLQWVELLGWLGSLWLCSNMG